MSQFPTKCMKKVKTIIRDGHVVIKNQLFVCKGVKIFLNQFLLVIMLSTEITEREGKLCSKLTCKFKIRAKFSSKRIHYVDRYYHQRPVSEELSLRHVT